jgi:hypothetical protein
MSQGTAPGRRLVRVARWAARLSAAALVLFWGAFFVAHLSWFADPQRLPPVWVFLLVGLHLLMLIGLLAGSRWELPGAALVIASSVPFFAAAAGRNFLWFSLVTAVPAVLWLYCAWQDRRPVHDAAQQDVGTS